MIFKHLSFRKKILLSYFLVFLLFLTLLFPFASQSVRTIVYKTFKQRALDLISTVSSAPTLEALIEGLRYQQQRLFFRVTLFDAAGIPLYDSFAGQSKPITKPIPPEIKAALAGSTGYNEEFSPLMGQELIYVARAFVFRGETLILRAAFPFKQFDELISDFEIGFLLLGSVILSLFALLTWMIILRLSQPIQRIIDVIKPYQEGKQETLPRIQVNNELMSRSDEFSKLATTLNSLSEKIQGTINTLTLERNNQELILESLGEGVIAVDTRLVITYANRFALELLDLVKEKIIGNPFYVTSLSHCEDLLGECQQKNKILASSLTLPKRRFLELLAVPTSNQKGAVLVFQDKSADYRLVEMGKDFVANASHELKTPITIIRGFAETLTDHPELPKDVSTDIIKKILRNCERMETLVRNLLILADIEKIPHSRLHECDLQELLENCKQMVLSVYTTALIEISCDPKIPSHIVADPDLLELAIMNLLTNAAKYSDAPARIRVLVLPHGAEEIKIEIEDQGIGIPAEDIDHIFDRFYTVNKAHSRKLGGSGLGLSITKTIIEKHKGSLEVHSVLGKGSIFTMILPVRLEEIF